MPYRLSRHAQKEAVRRRIPSEWLEAVVETPEQEVPEGVSKIVRQSRFRDERGKMYLVRAIIATDKEPAVLVTVYRTSKIEKYWRQP